MNYNAAPSWRDITSDSGTITEPVTLNEMKNYMRLEGFEDASSIVPEAPISLTLLAGQTSVQDDRLINAVILMLARNGTVYSQSLTVGNKLFVFDQSTGTVSFLDAGNIGGEPIDVTYGYTNNSGVFNFTNDDTLLQDMITGARELIEEMAGISIINHEWEAVLTNLCGRIEIPMGPVYQVTSLKDASGNLISSFTVTGNFWKYLKQPLQKEMVMTYTAGYGYFSGVPKGIKIDIMRLVCYIYENRGDDANVKAFALQLAQKYSRNILA